MSTSYQSVMFPSLERGQVAEARDSVLIALVDGGLIDDTPARPSECGFDNDAYSAIYPPARGLNRFISPELRARNRIDVGDAPAVGVLGIREGFGINPLAFNLLADCAEATCPNCSATVEFQDVDDLASSAANSFWSTGAIPPAECPRCHASADIRNWVFNYPLGFTYLAFEFWDWPGFIHPQEWTLDIPQLMSRAAGGIRVELGGARQ